MTTNTEQMRPTLTVLSADEVTHYATCCVTTEDAIRAAEQKILARALTQPAQATTALDTEMLRDMLQRIEGRYRAAMDTAYCQGSEAHRSQLRAARDSVVAAEAYLDAVDLIANTQQATPLPTTPEPLGYIPTDAIDQIKTPPRLITHKVPVLSYAAEGYTAIYTQPAAQATRTTADTLREIKAASCKDCGASGYTDPGEADSPDGPGRPAVVCGACMGTGWRDGVHISDQQATPASADDMKVYDGMAAGYFADARQATPEPVQPFFVRDVAALLGVSVTDVCKALAHLGHGQRSTNMVISPDEALAVAEHIRPATPVPVGEPAGEVVGWSYEVWRQDQGEGGQSKWCREASDWEPPAASSFFRNIRPLTYAYTHPAPGVPQGEPDAWLRQAKQGPGVHDPLVILGAARPTGYVAAYRPVAYCDAHPAPGVPDGVQHEIAAALALFPINITGQSFVVSGFNDGKLLEADGDTFFFSQQKVIALLEKLHTHLAAAQAKGQ